MKYVIDDEIGKQNGLKLEEILAILLIKSCENIPKLFEDLENRNVIKKDMFNNYFISQGFDDKVCSSLLDADESIPKTDDIESLALELMEIFPKEKKAGTCHYFRGNRKDNILRLKKFFKLYGNKYSREQILNAARKYVESFNGQYAYMRILKYFIWKEAKRVDSEGRGYIEEISDLASYIENEGCDNNDDWTTSLR